MVIIAIDGNGRIDKSNERGCNFRVPERNGCLTDLILNVKIPVTEAIHDAFKQAAHGKLKSILLIHDRSFCFYRQ